MADSNRFNSVSFQVKMVPVFAKCFAPLLLGLAVPFNVFLAIVMSAVATFVLMDFQNQVYHGWPLKIRIRRYLVIKVFQVYGMYESWRYHNDSKHIRRVQEQTMLRNLSLNADTAYYSDHNLGNVKNIQDFQNEHPLITYKHISKYVEKMVSGEQKQLTSLAPSYFGFTSGTSGSRSIVPHTRHMTIEMLKNAAIYTYNADKSVPWSKLHWARPVWKTSYMPPRIVETTKSGILLGPMTANPLFAKSGEIYTIPTIAFQIEDVSAGGYLQLLFALRFRELGAIEGIFSSSVYSAFQRMELEWPKIVKDVRTGTFGKEHNVPDHIRAELMKHLTPDPQRADELEKEFKQGFDSIASRVWPELAIVNCVTTGSFAIYAKYLRDHYCKGLLIYSVSIASTEAGFMAANYWPHVQPARYSLLPRTHFYEFIKANDGKQVNPITLLADEVTHHSRDILKRKVQPDSAFQVQLGEEYEVVITTVGGLCRYRTADIVRVVSFYNEVPLVEFCYRSSAMLNCKAEKLTEEFIYASISEAAAQMASSGVKRIADYTCCESIFLDLVHESNAAKGCYHVYFVEFDLEHPEVDQSRLAAQLAEHLDEIMQKTGCQYQVARETNSISSPLVFPVKKHAFHRLKEHILHTSTASFVQIKIPRVLLKAELLKFMLNERLYRREMSIF